MKRVRVNTNSVKEDPSPSLGMGFSLPLSEVAGSIAALAPTRSALRAALCAGYTAVPTAQYCLGDRRKSFNRSPYRRACLGQEITPASPSLGFLTDFIEPGLSGKCPLDICKIWNQQEVYWMILPRTHAESNRYGIATDSVSNLSKPIY